MNYLLFTFNKITNYLSIPIQNEFPFPDNSATNNIFDLINSLQRRKLKND